MIEQTQQNVQSKKCAFAEDLVLQTDCLHYFDRAVTEIVRCVIRTIYNRNEFLCKARRAI